MLQIRNISKEYRTGSLVQKALDGVSLNLRDSEFVAILGPSGSGKTTLLNVIGGLDRYDSGDLLMNGVSTKKYSDRDWDTYRNHTIGFVFQSYNLIPHQSVLANVELALTISGVPAGERRRRSQEALRRVGLEDQMHKKPNQLSGGQMQRVAIARALVNDPDILLADEPTGALDTDTGLQVMELLGEVARDRLVVMVTHNPDLANAYATRIVNLRDGKILSDSDPYLPESVGKNQAAPTGGSFEKKDYEKDFLSETEAGGTGKDSSNWSEQKPAQTSSARRGRTSMSLWTALSLSFQNLRSKKTRTVLTAFAGSIGIIGIALILAVSNGANNYVEDIEAETMSEYPIQIQKTSLNFSAMLSGSGSGETEEGVVNVDQVLGNFLLTMDSNDLTPLKEYLDSGESGIEEYASAVEYIYSLTPLIYRVNEDGSIHQVNPDQSFNELFGLTSLSSANSLVSDYLSSDVFFQMPENEDLYKSQYDVLAGHWPENSNECVLVLTEDGSINDWLLYAMGLRAQEEYDEIMSQFLNEEEMVIPENIGPYEYEEVLGITFKVINSADCYVYDEDLGTWVDKSSDEEYMEALAAGSEDLTIVGIVQPAEDASGACLEAGINYPASLIVRLAEYALESEIVQEQLANPEIDVFTGEPFGEEEDEITQLADLFAIDEEALAEALGFTEDAVSELLAEALDLSALSDLAGSLDWEDLIDTSDLAAELGIADAADLLDLSGSMDVSDLFSAYDLSEAYDLTELLDDINLDDILDIGELLDLSEISLEDMFSGVEINFHAESLSGLITELAEGYAAYAAENPEADYSKLTENFAEWLETEEAKEILSSCLSEILEENAGTGVTQEDLEELLRSILLDYLDFCEEQGVTDWSDQSALMEEYAGTDRGRDILTAWIEEYTGWEETLTIPENLLESTALALAAGYQAYAQENGLYDPASIAESFAAWLKTEEGSQLLLEGISELVDLESLKEQIAAAAEESLKEALSEQISEILLSAAAKELVDAAEAYYTEMISSFVTAYVETIAETLEEQIAAAAQDLSAELLSSLGDSLADALEDSIADAFTLDSAALTGLFDVDEESLLAAFGFSGDSSELTDLLLSITSSDSDSYDNNLLTLGYVDFEDPSEIDIYPVSFESKEEIEAILDDYNARMEAAGLDDQTVTYVDSVGSILSSVTEIINVISYVLIAFVAISLVVSSIMIGVITRISVMERRKEIGILRAIGASRRNIAQVFNAETFIIGLAAGVLGVVVTLLLQIPVNYLIHTFAGTTDISASLPVGSALVLVLLSILLTLVSGLLPARRAAKSDPVEALRAE